MLKKSLSILCALSIITVLCLTVGCVKNNPPAITENIPSSDATAQSENDESTAQSEDDESTAQGKSHETTISSVPGTTRNHEAEETTAGKEESSSVDPYTPIEPPIGKPDFGGRTFVIAADPSAGSFGRAPSEEINSEGTDIVSLAVRQRNKTIETLYNCKIELQAFYNAGSAVTAEMVGDQHTIDLFTTSYNTGNRTLIGASYNLYALGLNLDNSYWDQSYISAYSMKNNNGATVLYSILGDFALNAMSHTHVMMFNKAVYEKAGITDDLYELVRTKKWTMDKFAEMCKIAESSSTDGNIRGWVRTGYAAHGLHCASALSIIENKNGIFYFAVDEHSDEWNALIDRAIEIWNLDESETILYSDILPVLQNGSTLFASDTIDTISQIKNSNISLIPYPLYSETQENYAHYVDKKMATYAVPVYVSDIEAVGEFFELFAYHSSDTVRDAWIDTYAYEICADVNSGEMLGLILNTRTYDPAYHCFTDSSYGSPYETGISGMILTGKNDITRWAKRYGAPISEALDDYIAVISSHNG